MSDPDSGSFEVIAPPGARAKRRPPGTSAHTVLGALTLMLVGVFVYWRLSAQRDRIQEYWKRPLAASAQGFRARTEEWFEEQRHSAMVLGSLAALGRGPGSAFERALAQEFKDGDLVFASIREGDVTVRCTAVPLATNCVPGSPAYVIPSPMHPQAMRERPFEGHALLPAVGAIEPHGSSPGGVVTLWVDPERTLMPKLVANRPSITASRSMFVHMAADSAIIVAGDTLGHVLPRMRVPVSSLPSLITGTTMGSDLAVGTGLEGESEIASSMYIPRLRWTIYRSLPYEVAAAPFSREATTEGLLAFLLGSFVIGMLVWTVRERRLQSVRVELAQARLESLQAQLRPHFLFNAMNTIATLIHDDAVAANTMLVRLADLLRLSLEHSDEAVIPLAREVELFDAYIAVERVRFGDSLKVTKQIAPDALGIPVMRWMLQPLAENAIKHGAGYSRGEARMDLRVSRVHGALEIVLADDGPNAVGPAPQEGVGLRNTRRRLEMMYGDGADLSLRRRAEGGTEAVLTIPLHPTALAGAPEAQAAIEAEPSPQRA